MAFTGKATFSAGATLPELAEDVSDIIGIVSPYETPLLDHLGDPQRSATSTIHEWLEDELLPNTDTIDHTGLDDSGTNTTVFKVAHGDRFQIGDQIKITGSGEVMLVTAVDTTASPDELTVTRGYGSTTAEEVSNGETIQILGNAALEGADRPATRFTNRTRKQNYTQIFTASVEVSGSQLAATGIGVADELDYQKQERVRELIRDLENCVVNGVAAASNPQGGSDTRRTMRGVSAQVTTNAFQPGVGVIPDGSGTGSDELNEAVLNAALRAIWQQSSGNVDTIVVNGFQKRLINSFISGGRSYSPGDERFRELVSVYETDFGVCRVVLSRWLPTDTLLLLDSSRIDVLPLAGRSFHYKPLASSGDSDVGQIIGEYTLEMRNENAHGVITGLATTQ
ncbi:MAG: DUF5309 family protein [Phycisphaerales bacterium]|nr:DUF5309 family protein [Phycisphaerales bacterium]